MKTVFLIITAFRDLFLRFLPQMAPRRGFAFLVHPRNIPDVSRKYPFARFLSDSQLEWVLAHFWPTTLSRITGVKKDNKQEDIPGWVITIPITAQMMMRDRDLARKFVIRGVKLAERKGAEIVGLGALTASMSRGGLDVMPHSSIGVTTGRLYTSHIIVKTADAIIKKLSLEKENLTVAIVGAAGSIGTASAQILARRGFKNITLVDLAGREERIHILKKLLEKIAPGIIVTFSESMDAIKDKDIIVAATNRPDAIIKNEHLKSGAIVIDDAQPSDVDPVVTKTRKDILVLEGGLVHTDTINPHFNFGLKHKEDLFSCLAEAILLSLMEHKGHFQTGEILELDMKLVETLEEYSEMYGFRLAEFQNFSKVYTEEDMMYVKKIREGNTT